MGVNIIGSPLICIPQPLLSPITPEFHDSAVCIKMLNFDYVTAVGIVHKFVQFKVKYHPKEDN